MGGRGLFAGVMSARVCSSHELPSVQRLGQAGASPNRYIRLLCPKDQHRCMVQLPDGAPVAALLSVHVAHVYRKNAAIPIMSTNGGQAFRELNGFAAELRPNHPRTIDANRSTPRME